MITDSFDDKSSAKINVTKSENAVKVDAVHFAVDMAHECRAIHPVFVGAAISVGGTHPGLDGIVEFVVVARLALNAEGVHVA